MARVVLTGRDKEAVRQGSAKVQAIVAQIMDATPSEIEARIDGLTVDQLRTLLTVLTLGFRQHEQRLRDLERRAAQRSK